MLNKLKEESNKKPFLSSKTIRRIWVFATSAMLVLWWWKDNYWDQAKNDYSKEDLYSALVDEMSFSLKWFIETIKEKNPNYIVDDKKLRYNEVTIIKLLNISPQHQLTPIKINLEIENINILSDILPSIKFLLDAMYWNWYSSILFDWKDHSDKVLVIDISNTWWEHHIRKLSIEDAK